MNQSEEIKELYDAADKIKEMMLEVTVDGTGMNALSPDIGYICGKTGSAETDCRTT